MGSGLYLTIYNVGGNTAIAILIRLCERSVAIQKPSCPGVLKNQNLWIATPLTAAREDVIE